MRRTEQVQGLRLMKFEEIYERTTARRLSQHEAASILGVSERTFRRWRDRFEASGAEGLYDRRLGRPSGRRLPVDTVMAVLERRCHVNRHLASLWAPTPEIMQRSSLAATVSSRRRGIGGVFGGRPDGVGR